MTPEQLMKKCQIGCHRLDDANNLLAECYGTIGKMLAWIEDHGERTCLCTKDMTGKVCKYCQCGKAK
jgi:hypothetical protein